MLASTTGGISNTATSGKKRMRLVFGNLRMVVGEQRSTRQVWKERQIIYIHPVKCLKNCVSLSFWNQNFVKKRPFLTPIKFLNHFLNVSSRANFSKKTILTHQARIFIGHRTNNLKLFGSRIFCFGHFLYSTCNHSMFQAKQYPALGRCLCRLGESEKQSHIGRCRPVK